MGLYLVVLNLPTCRGCSWPTRMAQCLSGIRFFFILFPPRRYPIPAADYAYFVPLRGGFALCTASARLGI
uniref:Putative secreted protein n=1 Tax=Anopheles darlingi TaxID=43151 RepID=A0A2M4DH96_ANODA